MVKKIRGKASKSTIDSLSNIADAWVNLHINSLRFFKS